MDCENVAIWIPNGNPINTPAERVGQRQREKSQGVIAEYTPILYTILYTVLVLIKAIKCAILTMYKIRYKG